MTRTLGVMLLGSLLWAGSASADPKKDAKNWKGKCASCHGADGMGQTDQGKKMQVNDMSKEEWQKSKTDADIKKAITDGAKKGDAVMDGFKDKLDEAQIDGLVAYIRTLKK